MMRVQEKAFDIGRALGKRPFVSRLFCLVERALPLQRLARSHMAVACRHPRPGYDPHILVVPTTPFPTLATSSLPVARKSELVWEMVALARPLADPTQAQWQMIINGGQRQDIGQVHGHLIHAASDAIGPMREMDDPTSDPDEWNRLFDRIHRAAGVPANGFSVTFHFRPAERIAASFSESARR